MTIKSRDIVVIDIDGCLTDYPQVFLDWVSENKDLRYPSLPEMKKELTKEEYSKIKYEYRTSGIKKRLPINEKAQETIKELKDNRMKIWIITSRPKLDEVINDTKHWLDKNFQYDKVVFTDNKQDFLKDIQDQGVRVVIDDEIDFLKKIIGNKEVHAILLTGDTEEAQNTNLVIKKNWDEIHDYLVELQILKG